jgi:hypothetical protein
MKNFNVGEVVNYSIGGVEGFSGKIVQVYNDIYGRQSSCNVRAEHGTVICVSVKTLRKYNT